MEIFLFIVIVLQVGLFVYSDYQNRVERDKLQLKLMSRDLKDYVSSVDSKVEEGPKEAFDPYIDPEEANLEQIVNAREKL
jgi:hypothetical protein